MRYTVIVALSNRPIDQIKPDQQSREKVSRAYCYNAYTVALELFLPDNFFMLLFTLSLKAS